MTVLSKAFLEGEQAAVLMIVESKNPYIIGSKEFNEWIDGHQSCVKYYEDKRKRKFQNYLNGIEDEEDEE